MKREALHKLNDSDSSVFKDDVMFKYANDKNFIGIPKISAYGKLKSFIKPAKHGYNLVKNVMVFLMISLLHTYHCYLHSIC